MDLNIYDITKTELASIRSQTHKSRKNLKNKFLKGPIPLEWLKRASHLSGKALQISVCLWFLKGVHKKNTVALSYKLLEEFGVSRSTAYRGLKLLEAEGLIKVSRCIGRSPVFTIISSQS
jgi:DNA-binding MarR family transcriptional regulator